MPSGSFSKKARSVQSVTNKKNCGGNKKAGLAPRSIGPVEFRNTALNKQGVNFKIHQAGLPCPETYRNNPGGQCAGGVGALASTRARGCRNLGASAKKNNIPTVQYSLSYYYDGPNATPIALKGPNVHSPLFDNVALYGAFAQSINNNKQIVGYIVDNLEELEVQTPVFWSSPSAEPILLNGIDGGNVNGHANDINNNGEIVGIILDQGNAIPVYWSTPTSNAVALALGGNQSGRAISINELGNIVGIVNVIPSGFNIILENASYWDNTNRTTAVTILKNDNGDNAFGSANSINNSGEIVGRAFISIFTPFGGLLTEIVPFYWTDKDVAIGTPLKDTNGNITTAGTAFNINDNDNIVGVLNNKAVFWSNKDVNADELTTGGEDDEARSINNSGEIVGFINALLGSNTAYWGDSAEASTIIRTPLEIDFDENFFTGVSINNDGNFISNAILNV